MTIEFAKSLSGHDKNHIYYILEKRERGISGKRKYPWNCQSEKEKCKTFSDYKKHTRGIAGFVKEGRKTVRYNYSQGNQRL